MLSDALWSARLLVDRPDEILAVHREYLAAGADCVTTASYQASVPAFMARGLSRAEAVDALVRATELAQSAVDSAGAEQPEGPTPRALVAASVGPYGAYLADGSEYDGRYDVSDDELRAFHAERFGLLASSGADLLACETLPSAREAAVLLELLERTPDVWAWFTFSCPDGARIWDGTPIEEVAALCASRPRVAGVGVNCTAPRFAGELAERIGGSVDLPVIAYPNSGERYDAVRKTWSEGTPDPLPGHGAGWREGVQGAYEAGARVLGGCCRVGPREIAELRARPPGGDFPARDDRWRNDE